MKLVKHPKIKEVSLFEGKPIFPISWLHNQAYCEYQLFLENFEGVVAEPTMEMQQGKEIHQRKYEEFKEQATEKAKFEDVVNRAIKEWETFTTREMTVIDIDHGIIGLIDEVVISPERILVIDYKPGDYPYFTDKQQVRGYCLALENSRKPRLPLYGAIKQRDTGKIIWEEEFTGDTREDILSAVTRIQELISGKTEFERTDNERKCVRCRFKENC